MTQEKPQTRVFGIRHHGPGSARYLLAALDAFRPDLILIEGPADGQPLLEHVANPGLRPPVAMLLHRPDGESEGSRSAIYPFATWSPEWQALRYGVAHQLPCRLIDLPAGLSMGLRVEHEEGLPPQADGTPRLPVDPLQALAEAAGYTDGERWWDQLIEQHAAEDPLALFEAINEGMAAVRETAPLTRLTERREAHMRLEIRKGIKEADRVAVVCGAWHGPVLDPAYFEKKISQTADRAQLKGLKKVKVRATWVPWSHERLTLFSGYGAGIRYPRWYQHLWHRPETPERAWMTEVARLLREEQLDASTAQVIDAVRLAGLLAGMRGYTHPTIDELHDAALATFCNGDVAPLLLIEKRLYVGTRFGEIPDSVPTVPLQQYFEQRLKRLRLKATADETPLKLDLRKPLHLERSIFLHRLRLLGIRFGIPVQTGGRGTFGEEWKLRWEADHLILLIERSVWGSTLETAAVEFIGHQVAEQNDLTALSGLVAAVLPAALPAAMETVAKRLEAVAAVTGSIPEMMGALPHLVNALTYGDVRQTAADLIEPVLDALVPRICIGLPGAVSGLDRQGSNLFVPLINQAHGGLRTLARPDFQTEWINALALVADSGSVNGLLRGRAVRLLFDMERLDRDGVAQRLSQTVSNATQPDQMVDWLEGFLQGSGLVLIHHRPLLGLIDRWLSTLPEAQFMRLIPLLRRAFGRFTPGERFQIGEMLAGSAGVDGLSAQTGTDWREQLDQARADKMLPTFAELLGVEI